MTKQEINSKLDEILTHSKVSNEDKQAVEKLSTEFSGLRQQTENEQLQQFINDGGDSIEFTYHPDEEDNHFSNALTTFNQRLEKQQSARKESEEKTLEEKKKIINELKGIAKTDVKNLGKNFQKANELQARWKDLPHYSSDEMHQLDSEYKILLDTFYYDAQIVKDAIELDYQKNLEAKNKVVEKIQALAQEDNVQNLESKIRQYEKEWFRIGPVKREIRDETKAVLEEAIQNLQPILDKLYEDQQELLEDNLNQKIKVCEQLNEVLGRNYNTPKQYQQAADQVIGLQNQWREIGRSRENDRIWEVFSQACDRFFDNKRDYFKNLATNRKDNKQSKQDLIDKAESLKDSQDWKNTADQLIALQREWKKTGPAHPAEDQRLWEKFRSACDVFFDARKEYFKEQDNEFEQNLEQKQELINQLKSFQGNGDVPNTVKQLQEFEKQYQNIGYVPFKQKDKIHKAFYDELNNQYKKLNIDRDEKQRMRYESRIKTMATGNKPDKTLNFERNKIVQRIQELETKLAQYSNNFNITSDTKNNPLAQRIQKDIKDTERELENLQVQLQLIKDAKSGKLILDEEE